MAPNRNHAYTLGSPPPTLKCPHCPRHFKTKSGRTRHIQGKHPASPNRSEPHAPDTVARPSPIPSLPQPSFHDPSPVPSHFTPSLPPSSDRDGFNTDPNIDMDIPNINMDIEHPHPDVSRITRVFHPKLNGMSIFFIHIIDVNFSICRGDLRREWEWLTG
jgi:hypothetical protein